MQGPAKIGEYKLGIELPWDARHSEALEAKVFGEQGIDMTGIVLAKK